MKIAVGCDHAGVDLKLHIIKFLEKKKFQIEDFGINTSEPIDYPDVAYQVAKEVAYKRFDMGILICGTGAGMCIVANKVRGIRAVNVFDANSAKLTRTHNDANVLCLGSRILKKKSVNRIVDTWLKTKFEEGRHLRRVEKIKIVEKMVQYDTLSHGEHAS